ncbi:hypothetical protein [Aquirhabdus sp.]|uniref:hypothetical protein n=1 Tax=Aquirhabdus sp. TaxID=2824160 RepID=UPI00396CF1DB
MDTTENAGLDQALDSPIDVSGEIGEAPELEALHAESLDADDDELEEEQPKPVKPPAIERRIAELTRMRYESDRRAEEAERVAQALRQRYEEPVQQSPQDGRPMIEWFDTLTDYEHALEEYATRQVYQKVSHQFEQQRYAVAQAEVGQRFVQAESRFSKENPDYQHVVNNLSVLVGDDGLPAHLRDVILQSDVAPALLYELGQDLDEFSDFLEMPPLEQLMRLGEIRAAVKQGSRRQHTPQAAHLPKPISPVSSNASAKRDPYKMSDRDFLAAKGLR